MVFASVLRSLRLLRSTKLAFGGRKCENTFKKDLRIVANATAALSTGHRAPGNQQPAPSTGHPARTPQHRAPGTGHRAPGQRNSAPNLTKPLINIREDPYRASSDWGTFIRAVHTLIA